ncbi:methyltransferase domain-containing protein [Pseudoduganella sp. DS3]|uniref:Methyltransferase domain-containing protein n=1 Tax=Pseudoduganella guangdongensis TaxID=2692179 RepID=A0A6N9HIY7_9BURK|nr:methyltransferase [Pseudoduganella guangdongensis]MYN02755.1 methyltransferase domain-containing protein [Pseudoduganella guangdongensis]
MPEFSNRDPRTPEFWDQRFEGAFTPWDRGGVPAQLSAWLQPGKPGSDPRVGPKPAAAASQGLTLGSDPDLPGFAALIPGCGTAYELQAFCEAGWDATAIDFSPAAVAAAQQNLGRWRAHVVQADFFTYPATPDLIYERAFLCAMPREMWPRVVQRWAELLPAGGLLLGYFFFDDNPKGPPFGADRQQLDALMSAHFSLEWDEPVEDSLPVFQGKERWMAWRRKKGL